MEIYKNLIKIRKKEFFLFLITFGYIFLKSLFFERFKPFEFLIFIFEVYFTISVYSGIKKCVYGENFAFFEIFRDGLYFFPSILLYNLFLILSIGTVYSIALSGISSIRTSSPVSFFIFFLILSWAVFPFFHIFFTLYTPFIILSENETFFTSIKKSYNFMKENLSDLINLFCPFLIFWFFFFAIFQKYDKIIFLKIILLFFVSLLEILTVKTVFLIYKGVEK